MRSFATRLYAVLLFAAVLLCATVPSALAMHASESPNADPLIAGQIFPDVVLTGVLSDADKAYLGLEGEGPYKLSSVKTEVVILEIYSMYCPFCQKEAPDMVRMHGMIREKGLEDRIKIIGVAAGNSQVEVDVYREKFAIPFPLLEDYGYVIHKSCGEVGTPFFYVLKRGDGGMFRIMSTRLGQTHGAEAFLDNVIDKTLE